MAARYSKGTNNAHEDVKLGNLDVENMLKDSHHAMKILFFNRDRIALLPSDNFPAAFLGATLGQVRTNMIYL